MFQSSLAEGERIDYAHQRVVLHDLLLCSSVTFDPFHNDLWLRGTIRWLNIYSIRSRLRFGFLYLRSVAHAIYT
jgi:hypothetical protein